MAFRLRFFGGEHDGETYLVDPKRGVTLGRSPTNNIYVRDRNVSRVHAQIRIEKGECIITDLQSTNGTYVGGRRITEERVQPGDEVRIGLTTFRIEYVDDSVAETDTKPLAE